MALVSYRTLAPERRRLANLRRSRQHEWVPGWELPKEWEGEGIRAEGVLETTFVSDGAGCAPDWPTRAELRAAFLCGAVLSF